MNADAAVFHSSYSSQPMDADLQSDMDKADQGQDGEGFQSKSVSKII